MSYEKSAIYENGYALIRSRKQKSTTLYRQIDGNRYEPYLIIKPGMLKRFCDDFKLAYPETFDGEEVK